MFDPLETLHNYRLALRDRYVGGPLMRGDN